MDEKTQKRILTLTRPPGRTLADGSLSGWADFFEISLPHLCIFKMISVSWGSF